MSPFLTEYEEYGVPCRVCLLGLPCALSVGLPLSASALRSTGTYAGPGANATVGSLATQRSYELNAGHPTSAPRMSPAITKTGAREKGFMFSFVRARG